MTDIQPYDASLGFIDCLGLSGFFIDFLGFFIDFRFIGGFHRLFRFFHRLFSAFCKMTTVPTRRRVHEVHELAVYVEDNEHL